MTNRKELPAESRITKLKFLKKGLLKAFKHKSNIVAIRRLSDSNNWGYYFSVSGLKEFGKEPRKYYNFRSWADEGVRNPTPQAAIDYMTVYDSRSYGVLDKEKKILYLVDGYFIDMKYILKGRPELYEKKLESFLKNADKNLEKILTKQRIDHTKQVEFSL